MSALLRTALGILLLTLRLARIPRRFLSTRYTAVENPQRMVCLLHSVPDNMEAGGPLGFFSFHSLPLTYTLNEALAALAQQNVLPPTIYVDEITVVAPLKRAISEAWVSSGGCRNQELIEVSYYAPPSAEETAFASARGFG